MEAASDDLIGLLDQLQGIVEPPPVSMMPQTWAWAIVAALLLVAVAAILLAWRRHRHATAWRRAALAELAALAPGLRESEPASLERLETLLRRAALVTHRRDEAAPLTGEAWARFLSATGGDFGKLGPALAEAPYRPDPRCDGPAALDAARHWIRHQHA